MEADAFVALARAAAPSREELEAAGLDEADIDEIRGSFACPTRPPSGASSDDDELSRLLHRYDCSRFELSMFRFVSPPTAHPTGRLVGWLEADAVVQTPSGEVIVLDHESADAPATVCARTGVTFLDALGVRLRHGHGERSTELARACEQAAGVASPNPFWRTVAG
ncbi:MAG: hypothetical protein JNL79_34490 [Myxococcales bacterium]|nr:hypothetical protein [Myxococcales bacterium]